MAMIPIDEAKQRLQDLIDAVSQSHQPIVINSQNSNAILLSEADWLAIQETLYLVSIPGIGNQFVLVWRLRLQNASA
jgi:prevent-host-death family protein